MRCPKFLVKPGYFFVWQNNFDVVGGLVGWSQHNSAEPARTKNRRKKKQIQKEIKKKTHAHNKLLRNSVQIVVQTQPNTIKTRSL